MAEYTAGQDDPHRITQSDYLEVEAKLWVNELVAVEGSLSRVGAVRQHERILERNVRYEDATGSLTPGGIVLRLRQDHGVRLTYKGPQQEPVAPGLQSRFEAEVAVDDFATMDLILKRLGYRPFMSYEKYRTTYTLGDTEITLDEMPYGNFVEVEGAPQSIEQVIRLLDLTDCRRFAESYAVLFDHVRANLGLEFADLTFANFAGMVVPLAAFQPPGEKATS